MSALGLLYTTVRHGHDAMLAPNSVVLNVAVIPLREPAGIEATPAVSSDGTRWPPRC